MGAIDCADRVAKIGIKLWVASYLRRDGVTCREMDIRGIERWGCEDIQSLLKVAAKWISQTSKEVTGYSP